MLAFHNDPALKAKYLVRVRQHQMADEIIQGVYWQHGKGCAVGCTIHGNEHERYETELGIPRQLAYLQDRIFEEVSNEEAKGFPVAFLEAIPVGADLSLVIAHFLVWLLDDAETGVIRFASPRGKEAIQTVVALYRRKITGETIAETEWVAAAADAADASYAADAAAYAAAADAAYAAAAYAAAAAAAYAAYAADAYAAYAAYAAAKKLHFVVMRDKLLSLLQAAPYELTEAKDLFHGNH